MEALDWVLWCWPESREGMWETSTVVPWGTHLPLPGWKASREAGAPWALGAGRSGDLWLTARGGTRSLGVLKLVGAGKMLPRTKAPGAWDWASSQGQNSVAAAEWSWDCLVNGGSRGEDGRREQVGSV